MAKSYKITSTKMYVDKNFNLRWKLYYVNKPPKFGMWDLGLEDPATKASMQCRDGLVMAAIEAKNIRTKEIKIIVECSAADYVEHRWIAAAPSPTTAPIPIEVEGAIQGMTLVTRDNKFHVYACGRLFKAPMDERSTNYA